MSNTVDAASKLYAINFLQRINPYLKIFDTDRISKFKYYDLLAVDTNRFHYAIELKQRPIPSSTYDDIIVEESKLAKAYADINAGKIQQFWVMSLFTDCVYLVNSEMPHTTITRNANATTHFDDRTIIGKRFVSWKLGACIKYLYEPDIVYASGLSVDPSILKSWSGSKPLF